MAGMFYSLQEVAEKLNKTEDEIKQLVRDGKLREFRDGPNLLFKVDEVQALMSDTSVIGTKEGSAPAEQETEQQEVSLAAEAPADEADLTDEDTAVASEGIQVLGETDKGEYQLADDTMGETKISAEEVSLEDIEEDVSLDSFGSGSGLLDLSLQADDTSLGGILDEIYTADEEQGEEKEATGATSDLGVAAEAEEMLSEEEVFTAPEHGIEAEAPAVAQVYVEPEPDRSSNMFGIMLFLPLAVVIYTSIVVMTGFNNIKPAILAATQGLILPALGGVLVIAAVLSVIGFMPGGGARKAEKKPKQKKKKKAEKTEEAPEPSEAPEG